MSLEPQAEGGYVTRQLARDPIERPAIHHHAHGGNGDQAGYHQRETDSTADFYHASAPGGSGLGPDREFLQQREIVERPTRSDGHGGEGVFRQHHRETRGLPQ